MGVLSTVWPAADEYRMTAGDEHAIILQEDVLRLQMELNKTMEQYKRFWNSATSVSVTRSLTLVAHPSALGS